MVRRPRFRDRQRRRLAAKAKKLRFGRLKEVANLVTPPDSAPMVPDAGSEEIRLK